MTYQYQTSHELQDVGRILKTMQPAIRASCKKKQRRLQPHVLPSGKRPNTHATTNRTEASTQQDVGADMNNKHAPTNPATNRDRDHQAKASKAKQASPKP